MTIPDRDGAAESSPNEVSPSQERVEGRLIDYLDGVATHDERREIEATLAADARGRRLLDDLARVRHATQALGPLSVPTDLNGDLLRRLERSVLLGTTPEREAQGRRTRPSGRWALAAAAVLAIGLGTVAVALLPWGTEVPQVAFGPESMEPTPSDAAVSPMTSVRSEERSDAETSQSTAVAADPVGHDTAGDNRVADATAPRTFDATRSAEPVAAGRTVDAAADEPTMWMAEADGLAPARDYARRPVSAPTDTDFERSGSVAADATVSAVDFTLTPAAAGTLIERLIRDGFALIDEPGEGDGTPGRDLRVVSPGHPSAHVVRLDADSDPVANDLGRDVNDVRSVPGVTYRMFQEAFLFTGRPSVSSGEMNAAGEPHGPTPAIDTNPQDPANSSQRTGE